MRTVLIFGASAFLGSSRNVQQHEAFVVQIPGKQFHLLCPLLGWLIIDLLVPVESYFGGRKLTIQYQDSFE